jgi:uncharacterized protein YbjT (DUF2867 family)
MGMASQRVLLAGASGLVGGHLARLISRDLGAGSALLMPLRRPQAALAALPHAQVLAWPLQADAIGAPIDSAVCALGTTLAAAGSQAEFKAVDFDAVLAVAQAAKAAGARRFGLVSALGASASSAVFYNRIKGEAEAAIEALGFERLVIAQPSLLLGERHSLGQAHRPGEAWAQRLAPLYAWAVPKLYRPIAAEDVALSLWQALQAAPLGVTRLRSDRLQRT